MKYATPLRSAGLFALLLLLLSAQNSGCRRRAPGDTIVPATGARSTDFLRKQLERNKTGRIQTLTAKGNVYVEGNGMAVEAHLNLIWIRDSVLWLNVKKLGIEAARALITRDSVVVLNRLDQTYQAQSIDALQREYSLPEGFPMLQHLVLASAWLSPDVALQADIKDNLHRLSGSNHRFSADYRLEEGSFALRQEIFLQPRDARMLHLEFAQFKKLAGAGLFPYIRRVEVFSPESGSLRLDIELKDIEINVPKSYRFDIPAHYQRTE
ncbi:MAG: DUF4292 domain-containing protein [Saprospirales bacterium]|nr:DUF4292 domain-containing protein [Saprospirales bacterium]MBK8920744.1 DUF4292 domain-containing protein [Saprospirales bacterium]